MYRECTGIVPGVRQWCPVRVPGVVPGVYRECTGSTPVVVGSVTWVCQERVASEPGLYWGVYRSVPGVYRECPGRVPGAHRRRFGIVGWVCQGPRGCTGSGYGAREGYLGYTWSAPGVYREGAGGVQWVSWGLWGLCGRGSNCTGMQWRSRVCADFCAGGVITGSTGFVPGVHRECTWYSSGCSMGVLAMCRLWFGGEPGMDTGRSWRMRVVDRGVCRVRIG